MVHKAWLVVQGSGIIAIINSSSCMTLLYGSCMVVVYKNNERLTIFLLSLGCMD